MGQKQLQIEKGLRTYRNILYDPNEQQLFEETTMVAHHYFTGRFVYCILISILIVGLLMLVIIPIGSTFLYIDYLCKSKCYFGAECILDDYTKQPFCRCPSNCPDDYRPICGSDGVTYTNLCHLNNESCNKQLTITVASNTTCDSKLCTDASCHWYQTCKIDDKGRANCICDSNINCEHNQLEPVCGDDGKLYNSLCSLKRYNCLNKVNVLSTDIKHCFNVSVKKKEDKEIKHSMIKSNHSICSSCHPYAECIHGSSTQMICQCISNCSHKDINPICATNHKSYLNECELKREACFKQIDLQVLHHGNCGQCNKRCLYYSECKLNDQKIPECACPQVCISVDKPVCGSDGLTYENECELHVTSCRLKKEINVKFIGSCDLCHNVVCKYGSTCVHGECICPDDCENSLAEPLCANDGNTYRNECEMNRMACKSKRELIALFYGKCEETNDNLHEETTIHKRVVSQENPNTRTECFHVKENCLHKSTNAGGGVDDDNDDDDDDDDDAIDDNVFVCDNQIYSSKCDMKQLTCNHMNKCLKFCECNKYGLNDNAKRLCNPAIGQCSCKAGVIGHKCDRCATKFWDFKNIKGNLSSTGCKPCKCNKLGALREDCDKHTGRCACKPGVKGIKCDKCSSDAHLTNNGCVHNSLQETFKVNSCQTNRCQFGASCKENGTHSYCWCNFRCNKNIPIITTTTTTITSHSLHSFKTICASDGSVHLSMCHFNEYQCFMQKRLHILKHCPN